jgi:uncharacterized protein DUF6745
MSEIVPRSEVVRRLGLLDMGNPTVDRAAITEHFERFIRQHRPLMSVVLPVPGARIFWLPSPRDYRHRLVDLGLGLQPTVTITTTVTPAYELGDYDRLLPTLIRPLSLWPQSATQMLHDYDMLQCFEAGLGFYQIWTDGIVLIPRPGLRIRDELVRVGVQTMPDGRVVTRRVLQGVLHSLRGPAVNFPEEPAQNEYWIRGVRVPAFAVTDPERITREHIRHARTPELRRALIDQYGLLRYAQEHGFHRVDEDIRHGAILWVRGGRPRRNGMGQTPRRCIVELINSTPEPDGHQRHFARRVPMDMQSARQAVAWTFGFTDPMQYRPAVQT